MISDRYFVFVYPISGQVRSLLDLMVYTLDPREKWPAHITVAGPFSRKPRARSGKFFSQSVFIFGVWNFFRSGSNTVFLKAGMPDIDRYWNKPDFLGAKVPHISLYNGKDPLFARQLFTAIEPLRPAFSFPAQGIEVVNSNKQFTTILRERVDPDCLPITKGMSLDSFADLSSVEKIDIVRQALRACHGIN